MDLTQNEYDSKYVPVLRWKGAEIIAVRELADATRKNIHPLFELVPKDFGSMPLERAVALRVRDFLENWGWNDAFFIDFSLLDPAKAAAAVPIFDRLATDHLKATVTTGIHPFMEPAVLRRLSLVAKHGFCIRINPFQFRQVGFQNVLLSLVDELQLTPPQVDIIIDYAAITPDADRIETVLGLLPGADWKTVTVIAGAFPKDLSDLEKNNQYLLPRRDWLNWRKYALGGGTARFGDYAIQHGFFEEQEGQGRNFSASIRYTGPADWVIMRGEGVRNEAGPGYAQWPANAELLCARPEFCGPTFCFGDRYIKEMSCQSDRTGGPKEWLTAGLNHHLTYVVHQIAHLAETPNASAAADGAAPDWPAHISLPLGQAHSAT